MQLLDRYIHKHNYLIMPVFVFCFIMLGALYIYGINKTTVHTFGKSADSKRLADVEEELWALETERAHLAVGSWLEARAKRYELVTGGNVYVLSRDTAVARAE